jgi:hypothetical protein
MIINSNLPEIIKKIQYSDFEFFLTGSRFFNTNCSNPDWDFFTSDTMEVRTWLTGLGFYLLKDESNYSLDCVAVYRHTKPDRRIDVQLISNIKLKLKAQQLIKDRIDVKMLKNKRDSRLIWHAVMTTIANA